MSIVSSHVSVVLWKHLEESRRFVFLDRFDHVCTISREEEDSATAPLELLWKDTNGPDSSIDFRNSDSVIPKRDLRSAKLCGAYAVICATLGRWSVALNTNCVDTATL